MLPSVARIRISPFLGLKCAFKRYSCTACSHASEWVEELHAVPTIRNNGTPKRAPCLSCSRLSCMSLSWIWNMACNSVALQILIHGWCVPKFCQTHKHGHTVTVDIHALSVAARSWKAMLYIKAISLEVIWVLHWGWGFAQIWRRFFWNADFFRFIAQILVCRFLRWLLVRNAQIFLQIFVQIFLRGFGALRIVVPESHRHANNTCGEICGVPIAFPRRDPYTHKQSRRFCQRPR